MIDDIVTRLRGQRTNGVLCNGAADEIERLRIITEAAKQVAQDFPCTCWINQPKCPACQLLEALHND